MCDVYEIGDLTNKRYMYNVHAKEGHGLTKALTQYTWGPHQKEDTYSVSLELIFMQIPRVELEDGVLMWLKAILLHMHQLSP